MYTWIVNKINKWYRKQFIKNLNRTLNNYTYFFNETKIAASGYCDEEIATDIELFNAIVKTIEKYNRMTGKK